METRKPIIIHPRYQWLIYIFGSMMMFMLLAALYSYKYDNLSLEELYRYLFLAVFLLLFIIPLVWIISNKKIILHDEYLSYNDGFKKRELHYKTITKSDIQLTVKRRYPDTFWNFETKDKQLLSLQISYYSKKDLQRLANFLLLKSRFALHDSLVHNIADGKFPWYIR